MLRIPDLEGRQTPFYWYDLDLLERTIAAASAAAEKYGIQVHYAIKTNSEPRIASMVAAAGFGVECVSGNEILLAKECGFAPEKMMFDGVGKTDWEIRTALEVGIGRFNIESLEELQVVNEIAGEMGLVANVSLRVNPDVDAHTDIHITTGLEENKFGIRYYQIDAACRLLRSCSNVAFKGLQFHVGSQILDNSVFAAECAKSNEIVAAFESAGLTVENIDLGGGLGISYDDPDGLPIPDFDGWFRNIKGNLKVKPGQNVIVEPGRSLTGQCGSLIAKVLYIKETRNKTFMILDAGMNDLMRPALYGSYHRIENITEGADERPVRVYDVVGPICESTDVFAEGRPLAESKRGDFVAIRSAGAYGQTMASRYNSKSLAPAVYSK